ncbi:hypothetical protein AAFF_G00135690 [Aldrovandia affinis]|uniref:Uncharacterized protein n=1 Tax=Aldrovandia affinis TaxID=143900 RepID=A0AAD7W993_9TELE|nr:hypothetical protein AAFF_G00135690 [Aldrovandia affinis]
MQVFTCRETMTDFQQQQHLEELLKSADRLLEEWEEQQLEEELKDADRLLEELKGQQDIKTTKSVPLPPEMTVRWRKRDVNGDVVAQWPSSSKASKRTKKGQLG